MPFSYSDTQQRIIDKRSLQFAGCISMASLVRKIIYKLRSMQYSFRTGRRMQGKCRVMLAMASCAIGVLFWPTIALATSPELSSGPRNASLSTCGRWAAAQSGEALNFWGLTIEGKKSVALAVSRLTSSCLGDGMPDVVASQTSAGMHETYCSAHTTTAVCLDTWDGQECRVLKFASDALKLADYPDGPLATDFVSGSRVKIIEFVKTSQGLKWAHVADLNNRPLGFLPQAKVDCIN